MKWMPALVIALWALANWVLASLMWIWQENPIFIGLYFAGLVPVFGYALAVRLSARRRGTPPSDLRLSDSAAPVLPLAIGGVLVGLGLVFAVWISLLGALVVVLSFYRLARPAAAPISIPHVTQPYDLPLTETRGAPQLPQALARSRRRLRRRTYLKRALGAVAYAGVRALRAPAGRHRP